MEFPLSEPEPPPRERLFNAPWPPVLLALIILGGHLAQQFLPADPVFSAWGFSPAGLAAGRWETALTALFLHGGWGHALINAVFVIVFGTPVARALGTGTAGVAAFAGLFLVSGVLANLGYAWVNPGETGLLVGASGGAAGLMGASMRLIAGRGRPGPFGSPIVVGMSLAWLAVNLLMAVLPAGLMPGSEGASIAWEAHLFGYAAGLLLIGPVHWGLRRP